MFIYFKDLGNCICVYDGQGLKKCDSKIIKPSEMPNECTSFLVVGLELQRVNQTKDIPEKDVQIVDILFTSK